MKLRKMLISFLLPYFLVLLVSLSIGLACFSVAYQTIRNNVYELNSIINNQVKELVDSALTDIRNTSFSISQNQEMRFLSSVADPYDTVGSIRMYQISDTLDVIGIKHSNIIATYFVLLKKSDVIISPYTATGLDDFYGSHYMEQGVSYDDWRAEILNQKQEEVFLPARTALLGKKAFSCIPYVYTPSDTNISIVFGINSDVIANIIEEAIPYASGNYTVQDNQGRTVYNFNPEYKESEDQFWKIQIVSETTKWTYTSYLPYNELFADLYRIMQFLFLSMFIFFVGAIGFHFYNAYKISKPLITTESLLFPQEHNEGNILTYSIKSVLQVLNRQNYVLEIQAQQQTMLRSAFLHNLMLGEFSEDSEINNYLKLLNMSKGFESYQVIVTSLSFPNGGQEALSTANHMSSILMEKLKTELKETDFIIDLLDINQCVLLMFYPTKVQQSRAFIEEKMDQLSRKISPDSKYRISFSLGPIFEDLLDAPESYSIALGSSGIAALYDDKNWCWAEEQTIKKQNVFYSRQLENSILNSIYQGDYTSAEAVIDHIYEANIGNQDTSVLAYNQLIFSVKSFMYYLLQECGEDFCNTDQFASLYNRLRQDTQDINQIFSIFKSLVKICCEFYSRNSDLEYSKTIQSALSIMEEEFCSPDMSLSYVAEKLNVSDAYLSQLFKKEHGDNFSSYIEKLRLDRAVMLLQQNMRITEISQMCGYLNVKSFQRAFKRRFEISPTEYKKNNPDKGY